MFRIIALLGAAAFLSGCMAPRVSSPSASSDADEAMATALALVVRGQLAQGLDNDPVTAAALYDAAARAVPDHLGLTLLAGGMHLQSHATNAALAVIERAMPYHDQSATALYELGRLAWNGGEHVLARRLFLRAIRLDPDDGRPYSGLAFVDLQAGKHDEAHRRFEQALERMPEDPLPYIGMAMSALQEQDHDMVLRMAENAVKQGLSDPRLDRFFRDFTLLLIAQDALEQALMCAKALQKLAPDDLDGYHLAAVILARLGRHQEAHDTLHQWPDATTEAAVTTDLMADIYETLEAYDRAIEYALMAVADDDAPPAAWLRAGRLLLMAGDAQRASALMTQATDRYPSNAMLWLFRGLAYSGNDRYSDAVPALERAATLAEAAGTSLPPMFNFWIGAAYERNEDYQAAENHFRKSIDNHPTIHEAFNYLAYMWAERGVNLSEALELVKKALNADPENGAYIDTLGWIYYQQDEYEKALTELRRALDIKPDNAVINDHVGDALNALNRTDEAIPYWKRSFINDPDNDSVREKLEQAGIDPDSLSVEAPPDSNESTP